MKELKSPIAFIYKVPKDPMEREKFAEVMVRNQISMWLGDDCFCLYCKHKYNSIDDFIEKQPHRGHTDKISFVCQKCYPNYKKSLEDKT